MAKKIKENKERFSPLTVILLIILLAYCFTFFYLLIWGVSSSFKLGENFYGWKPGKLFSSYSAYEQYRLDEIAKYDALVKGGGTYQQLYEWNAQIRTHTTKLTEFRGMKKDVNGFLPFYTYKHIFKDFKLKEVGMAEMYVNSILYAGGCAFAATFVPCITAYACARFNYRFSRIIHSTVIIVMMIPIVGSMPSEIKMAQATRVYDKFFGLWVMRANFLGLYFLVFYDICKSLPSSFSEAAKMDGANNFQVFFKIALPLLKNTFMTVLLIRFIEFWNEYQAPMVYTPSFPTIAMGLNDIMGKNADAEKSALTTVPFRMTAAVLTATPVCILFACFQKRLLGNLTMGGVKG